MKILNINNPYNKEPVVYCSQCLSLKIRDIAGTDYCDDCGSTEIKEANIFDWEDQYEARYGEKYVKLRED